MVTLLRDGTWALLVAAAVTSLACGGVSRRERGRSPGESAAGASPVQHVEDVEDVDDVADAQPGAKVDPLRLCQGNELRFAPLEGPVEYRFDGTFDGRAVHFQGDDGQGLPVIKLLVAGAKFLGVGLYFSFDDFTSHAVAEVVLRSDDSCGTSVGMWTSSGASSTDAGSVLTSTTTVDPGGQAVTTGALHFEFIDADASNQPPRLMDGSFVLEAQIVRP